MKETVIISGKGGTGKTSLVAGLATLEAPLVLADCDVDAADLHLVLEPEIKQSHPFRSGHEAVIRQADCIGCGACLAYCRFDAIRMDGSEAGGADFYIDPVACEGCGVCVHFCPQEAIDFPEKTCGEWYISGTRHGPMVHAKLGVAEENSGKLVSLVRQQAREAAEREGYERILVDGSPGIGCPVIASITGADRVVVVTEPTLSGLHDLKRVAELTGHFELPTLVCVNKWDINEAMTEQIEGWCTEQGLEVVGRIPYDNSVTRAQIAGRSIVEMGAGPVAEQIRELAKRLRAKVMEPS